MNLPVKKLSVYEGRMRSVVTIHATAGHGGSITPSARVSIGYGLSKMFAITPRWGYLIEDVKIDGASVGPVSTYLFTNLTDDHTIGVTFKRGVKRIDR